MQCGICWDEEKKTHKNDNKGFVEENWYHENEFVKVFGKRAGFEIAW